MAFKIESLSTMTQIANNTSDVSNKANVQVNDTIQTLEELAKVVSGDGVDTAIVKLTAALKKLGEDYAKRLSNISTFISSQTTSYTTNEEDVNTTLNSINSTLQGLEE